MTKNRAILQGGSGDGSTEKRIDCSHSMKNKKMKKNLRRLGGKGLSLEAFVNAKTKSGNYNPSLIKKQKEFYKNAKFVKKYKRLVKAHDEPSEPSVSKRISEELNETVEADIPDQKNDKSKRNKPRSIKELYEKRHEEEEKKRIEREAIIQAKKEERERAEVRRKQERQKMFKKTKSGQPVMKYRIEHLLQTLQGSSG
ncbi:unnamed protein product [Cuscuta campestris]|uniref:rRNA-processing protein FYV7 n=2 Tax=Cuscuta sect. Cleistogrammica TaxID=1824901 RepID=A0A484LQX4_9ASTE|nr:hypothetical protein DM860_015497 [Cuscuta australis]VFQ78637.1 unnamed protein product [Cuscuta campestris]